MKKFNLSTTAYAALFLAVAALVVVNAPVFATAAQQTANSVVAAIRPWIKLAHVGVIVACFALALFSAFKATRGDSGEWVKVIGLGILGGLLIFPVQIAGMLGMNAAANCINLFLNNAANATSCNLL